MGNPDFDVKAINDPFMDLEYMANQLGYDSVAQNFHGSVAAKTDGDKSSWW